MKKRIDGYPNYYIYPDSTIENAKTGRILRQNLKKSGYVQIDLSNKGKVKTFRVHILVARAFHPNPKAKAYVNHKDTNKSNNHKDNLEWVTPSENAQHSWDIRKKLVEALGISGDFEELETAPF